MRAVRLGRQGLVLGLAVLAILAVGPQASAQDRAKVEIVPNIPHSLGLGITSLAVSPDGARLLLADPSTPSYGTPRADS